MNRLMGNSAGEAHGQRIESNLEFEYEPSSSV